MGNEKSSLNIMPEEVRHLHLAVIRNDIWKVQQLVDAGTDLDYPWLDSYPSAKDGSTPLCEAVSLNHRAIVEELINSGADVNKPDACGFTPLHKSSYHGRAHLTTILINAGADVHLRALNRDSPLLTCTRNFMVHKDYDTVYVLVQAGSDLHAVDYEGKTPLHYAVMWSNGEVTELLLQANSDMDFIDYRRQTPLCCLLATASLLPNKRFVFEKCLPTIKPLVLSGCDTLNLGSWLFENKILSNEYHMDEEFYAWYCGSRPESLLHLCRAAIVKYINNENQIKNLPLPEIVLKYLFRRLL